MTTNDRKERAKMVCAMEYIARQVNHEGVFEHWLMNGVADGDIDRGCFDDNDTLDYYVEDKDTFADLMQTFLEVMYGAYKDGGLYCNGVVSHTAAWWDRDEDEDEDDGLVTIKLPRLDVCKLMLSCTSIACEARYEMEHDTNCPDHRRTHVLPETIKMWESLHDKVAEQLDAYDETHKA